MGRDEAAAERLMDHRLHIIGQWENPGLVKKAELTGGSYHTIDSITDVELIADLVEDIGPLMFFTHFDSSLAAGVVDAIQNRVEDGRMPDLWIPSPTKEAAKVEWDKFFLREIIDEINPRYNPWHRRCTEEFEVKAFMSELKAHKKEVAIKPRNLSGGKGVKVMGKHFETYDQAEAYAYEVLASPNQTGVEVQEKLEGPEFTMQIFTDGSAMINPPLSYDYPYLNDGDTGPGTGGTGAFTMKDGLLPFVDQDDYNEAMNLMADILVKLKERGIDYKGVLYPTFFKTEHGLKIVEINARGGDPELVNIQDLMEDDVNYADALVQIAEGTLDPNVIRYKKLASCMRYYMSPDYPGEPTQTYNFDFDEEIAGAFGCKVRYAATERVSGRHMRTVGASRNIGLLALKRTPWAAKRKVDAAGRHAFGRHNPLHHRNDVGNKKYIKSLNLR